MRKVYSFLDMLFNYTDRGVINEKIGTSCYLLKVQYLLYLKWCECFEKKSMVYAQIQVGKVINEVNVNGAHNTREANDVDKDCSVSTYIIESLYSQISSAILENVSWDISTYDYDKVLEQTISYCDEPEDELYNILMRIRKGESEDSIKDYLNNCMDENMFCGSYFVDVASLYSEIFDFYIMNDKWLDDEDSFYFFKMLSYGSAYDTEQYRLVEYSNSMLGNFITKCRESTEFKHQNMTAYKYIEKCLGIIKKLYINNFELCTPTVVETDYLIRFISLNNNANEICPCLLPYEAVDFRIPYMLWGIDVILKQVDATCKETCL